MDITTQGSSPGGQPALVKDSNMAGFMADVVQASMEVPVLVDFWAPWCGPCKQLGPILEKVVTAAGGKVRLVKVNIDEPQNQPLAQQLRIQSIPAVYAFHQGQPVDGFMGALPESQVREFVERLTGGPVGSDGIGDLIEDGKAALEAGEVEIAAQAFTDALQIEPENPAALAGMSRALLGMGQPAEARVLLEQVPVAETNNPEVVSARAALDLAEQAAGASGDLAGLEARVASDPGDMQARFDLAMAQIGAGRREAAVDNLLEIVRVNRGWNDEAARKQLVTLFEAFGPMDPLTIDARKRLSTLLFR